MKSWKELCSIHAVLIVCLLVSYESQAKPPPTAAECEDNLSATVVAIDYGRFESATGGTITMLADGSMSATGDILLFNAVGTPAEYTLSISGKNCDKKDILVTPLGISGFSNQSGSPATTLTADNLVTDLASTTIQIRRVNVFKVGARITVPSGSAKATYQGSVEVEFSVQ
jgi:hypothetical protein